MNNGRTAKYSHSLLFKALLIYFFLFAVPIILLYASLYGTSRRLTQKEGASQLLSSLKSISNTMDEVFRSVNFVQSQLQGNTAFSNDCFFMDDEPAGAGESYKNYKLRQTLSMELYKLYLSNPYLYSLEVYSSYGDTLFGNYPGQTRQIQIHPLGEQIDDIRVGAQRSSIKGNRAWYLLPSSSGETLFASYSRPFCAFSPNMYTYSRAVISRETLHQHIKAYDSGESIQFYIRPDSQDWVPISGHNPIQHQDLPETLNGDFGWISFSSDGISSLMAYYRSQYTGWYYGAAVPLEHYNISEPLMTEYWFYIVITLMVIFILTALFVSFYLIRPMKQISDKMREAEHGDLNVRIHTKRRDELGYISHRLNVLLKNIDSLIHTNYETRLLKEGYELKFIQTQLKEHFIYNTLDSIHWIADKNNVPQISQIIFDLSRFFRLTLNQGTDYISIRDEARVLESYLALCNVRMDGTIKGSIEIDPSIENERVIKYFFQPVLENAVVHGVRPLGGGTISIRFRESRKGYIQYQVTDNGAGISPIDLNDIHFCIEQDRSDGKYFALINLNRQMRLYFGDDFSFSIESRPGCGTQVSIEFPKGCEQNHDESNHY